MCNTWWCTWLNEFFLGRAAEKKAVEKQQEAAMHEAEEKPDTAEADPPPVAQVSHIPAFTCLPSAAPSLHHLPSIWHAWRIYSENW